MEILAASSSIRSTPIFCAGSVEGGLIAGHCRRTSKALGRRKQKIIGVEPERFQRDVPVAEGQQAGHACRMVNLFADGVAGQAGLASKNILKLAKQAGGRKSCWVDTDEICAAIKDIFQDTRLDHGAFRWPGALAGIKRLCSEREKMQGARPSSPFAAAANMNFDRLRFIRRGVRRLANITKAVAGR